MEIIVPTGAGGTNDQMARLMKNQLEANNVASNFLPVESSRNGWRPSMKIPGP